MPGPDGMIRPDFKLWDVNKSGQRCILEHWGIDEHDPTQRAPDQWNMSWTQYKSLMNKKRQWYKAKNRLLIETSILDLQNGREEFEGILTTRLRQAGIHVERLPDEVILRSLMEKQSKGFAGLVQQAISRAKRSGLGPEDVKRLIETTSSLDERTTAFWKVVIIVYSRYQAKLVQEGYIDFDDLIQRAVQIIEQSAGNCHFKVRPGHSIAVRDLQYLLIDEYQDFSQLFYDLVQSIRRQNPMLRILCVGDDWQAINGFAGSHLRYFTDFEKLFPIAETTTLLTNHRSRSQIVQQSNEFMHGKGDAAVYRSDLGKGEVGRILIENVWLPPKDGNTFTQLNYCFADFDPAFLSAKFIKACHQIITTPRNRGKTCVILSRTNWIYRRPVVEFKKKLKELLDEEEYKLISFSTIHSYKGLEADITIVADASSENFPFIHPDNQLLSPLGVKIEEVIEEEKRLFYVAMTRAKEQLYVFAEKDAMSIFIKHLPSVSLDDVAPSLTAQDLWVGVNVSGTKETYVYDPAFSTRQGEWVHLYHVEKDHIAKYHIDTLKPLIKTATKNKEGEVALQQYMQWKNSDRGRKYITHRVADHFSKKVDWIECPCAICSGTPHLDPLFISAFEPISMEDWVAEIADMRREKESLRRRS
jgi:DNA helicase-4